MTNNDSVNSHLSKIFMRYRYLAFMRVALLLTIAGIIGLLVPNYALCAETLPKGKELTIKVSRKKVEGKDKAAVVPPEDKVVAPQPEVRLPGGPIAGPGGKTSSPDIEPYEVQPPRRRTGAGQRWKFVDECQKRDFKEWEKKQ
jgi:hypothetical protein